LYWMCLLQLMSLADPSVCARKPTPGGGSGGSSGSNKGLSIGSIICIVYVLLLYVKH